MPQLEHYFFQMSTYGRVKLCLGVDIHAGGWTLEKNHLKSTHLPTHDLHQVWLHSDMVIIRVDCTVLLYNSLTGHISQNSCCTKQLDAIPVDAQNLKNPCCSWSSRPVFLRLQGQVIHSQARLHPPQPQASAKPSAAGCCSLLGMVQVWVYSWIIGVC